MTRRQRRALFNGLAIAFVLGAGTLNTWLLVGGAAALLALGWVLVPEQRGRGLLAAGIAVTFAVAAVGFVRLLR